MATDRPEPMPPLDEDEEDTRAIDTDCKKCGYAENVDSVAFAARTEYKSEHLKVTCQRCGYGWEEYPLDVSDALFKKTQGRF